MKEPTNQEIRKRHAEVDHEGWDIYEGGEEAHEHRGILLDRLEALQSRFDNDREVHDRVFKEAEQYIKELESELAAAKRKIARLQKPWFRPPIRPWVKRRL